MVGRASSITKDLCLLYCHLSPSKISLTFVNSPPVSSGRGRVSSRYTEPRKICFLASPVGNLLRLCCSGLLAAKADARSFVVDLVNLVEHSLPFFLTMILVAGCQLGCQWVTVFLPQGQQSPLTSATQKSLTKYYLMAVRVQRLSSAHIPLSLFPHCL